MTVLTDDLDNRQIPLTITGRVLAVYTLSAKSVILSGVAGEKIQETIRLIPSRDYPFTVKDVTAKRGQNIRFHLAKVGSTEDIQYELTVENTATNPGVYFDTLQLKTDSETKPEIDISVVGRIRAATTGAAEEKDGPGAAGDL